MSVADSKLSNAALVERGNVFAPFHFKCFLGNTDVFTRRGFRRIDSIEAGEEVLTHKRNWRRVLRAFGRPYSGELIRVQSVVSTADHPYLVKRNGKNLFDAVREADHVATFDQKSIRFFLPEITRLWEDNATVWNLTVEEDESYVVGRGAGSGLIVHNCRCNMDITEEEELIPVL